MNTLDYKVELNQLNKILISYKTKPLKETLIEANYFRSRLPNLNKIPQFHNIVGLINFRLNDLKEAISDFKKAINLNPNFHTGYYNLGLAYFNNEDLEKSFKSLTKALLLNKDYKLARDKIIELLSFYEPDNISNNPLINLHKKIKNIPLNINFSNKISDQQIINYFKNCNSIVSQSLDDHTYSKVQIYRKKTVFLNCERHKSIFSKYKTIPKYCFGCFKVVIEAQNFFDLLKLSLIFDKISFFSNFNRKNMIDKKTKKDVFKSIIYCTSLKEVIDTEIKTENILKKYLDDFVIQSKRGCHEFALEYPDYEKIFKKNSELMRFPQEWIKNEQEFDLENKKNVVKEKSIVSDTINGTSLHDILIINNWFKDQHLSLKN